MSIPIKPPPVLNRSEARKFDKAIAKGLGKRISQAEADRLKEVVLAVLKNAKT